MEKLKFTQTFCSKPCGLCRPISRSKLDNIGMKLQGLVLNLDKQCSHKTVFLDEKCIFAP